MTNLEANSIYEFSLGDSDNEHRWLKTSPVVGFDTPVKIIAVADTGEAVIRPDKNPGANKTFKAISKEINDINLILHAGDLSYANGDPNAWDSFMDLIEPVASHVPYMVAIGNHEFDYIGESDNDPSEQSHFQPNWGNYENDSGGECGVPVVKRFPSVKDSRNDQGSLPFWYSFNHGSVHVITLSTEHSLGHKHPQYQWLKEDLASVVRCRTPWIIIQMHRPMYIPSDNDKGDVKVAKHIRHHLEDLIVDYEVDLVISGHFHSFYRTCLVHDKKCRNKKGVTNLVVGNGGRHFDSFEDDLPDWVVRGSDEHFGYARISVESGLVMKVEVVRSEDGYLLDEFKLDKRDKSFSEEVGYAWA
eukprot:TRINITY_DN1616_c0_g1_i3.p1 TRINITY_DN1616_c0_g1~~TRINITY_DN1616_c0_g1_i3.p1  ORF type:complete len:367 (-),score=35.26 TRINITY_DN1616_c0_g1_i3:342-1418(-)